MIINSAAIMLRNLKTKYGGPYWLTKMGPWETYIYLSNKGQILIQSFQYIVLCNDIAGNDIYIPSK